MCHSANIAVKNSRKQKVAVWRRRSCKNCGFIFTTNEHIDTTKLLRIQKSTRKKQTYPYSRGALLQALYESLSHNGNDLDAPLFLLETIETAFLELAAEHNFAITIQKFHEITLEILGRYDPLAALNYKARFL